MLTGADEKRGSRFFSSPQANKITAACLKSGDEAISVSVTAQWPPSEIRPVKICWCTRGSHCGDFRFASTAKGWYNYLEYGQSAADYELPFDGAC